jgi:hypothetical protein
VAITLTAPVTLTCDTSDDYAWAMSAIQTANSTATANGTPIPISNVNGDPVALTITLNVTETKTVPPSS